MDKPTLKILESDFLEFLSTEEHNLLTFLHTACAVVTNKDGKGIRPIFDAFYTLDKLYKDALRKLHVAPDEDIIGALLLFVHFHFYFSVTCQMRCHNAEGLASTRKAIDAALSAYMIILDPRTIKKYQARNKVFLRIKSYMEGERKKDNSKYPLAAKLIDFHSFCSQYGSHADIDGFIKRMKIVGKELSVMYFEIESKKTFRLDFAKTLKAYLNMLEIFRPFLLSKVSELKGNWETEIDSFRGALEIITTRIAEAP